MGKERGFFAMVGLLQITCLSPLLLLRVVSSLESTTGKGEGLECDCDRVKCNCVKRCDCHMPDEMGTFLEIEEREEPVDWQQIFLQTSEGLTSQGINQNLDCDCDKVKCNCIKHCECHSKTVDFSSAAALASNIQINQAELISKNDAEQMAKGSADIPGTKAKPTSHETKPVVAPSGGTRPAAPDTPTQSQHQKKQNPKPDATKQPTTPPKTVEDRDSASNDSGSGSDSSSSSSTSSSSKSAE